MGISSNVGPERVVAQDSCGCQPYPSSSISVRTSGRTGRVKTIIEVVGIPLALLVGVLTYLAAANGNEIAQQDLDRSREADSRKLAESVWPSSYRERANPSVVSVTVFNNGPTKISHLRFESKGEADRVTIVRLRDVKGCKSVRYTVAGAGWNKDSALVFRDIDGKYWKRKEGARVESAEPEDPESQTDQPTYKLARESDRLIRSHGRDVLNNSNRKVLSQCR
jgi:hypothetical protein